VLVPVVQVFGAVTNRPVGRTSCGSTTGRAADLSRRPSVESTEPPVITARTVLCPGAERLDVKLTVGLHVVPTVRRGGAVPLLPLFVFMG
jgi:hypothetical protein